MAKPYTVPPLCTSLSITYKKNQAVFTTLYKTNLPPRKHYQSTQDLKPNNNPTQRLKVIHKWTNSSKTVQCVTKNQLQSTKPKMKCQQAQLYTTASQATCSQGSTGSQGPLVLRNGGQGMDTAEMYTIIILGQLWRPSQQQPVLGPPWASLLLTKAKPTKSIN